MSNSTQKRKILPLAEMQPTMTNFSTVVLIISKSSPNLFLDKLSGNERGVITLTVRDSISHITNCTCWGQKSCVDEYDAMLHIGDAVDIVGAKVMSLSMPHEPRYQPRATLSCALTVNEGSGHIVRHDTNDTAVKALQQLIHKPHKPLGSALNLVEVCSGIGLQERLINAYVDLLVVVAAVRPLRELKRKLTPSHGKDNGLLQCLELIVIDASYPDGMLLSLWQAEWIRRAQYWEPRRTVLHLIDVRISYSDYYRCPVLNHAACTLIYENPQAAGGDCDALLSFVATVPLKNFEQSVLTDLQDLPTACEIQSQMTTKQIYSRAEGELCNPANDRFTAVLYCMVTKFDIDGFSMNTSKKCTTCQRLIPRNQNDCTSEACQLVFSLESNEPRHSSFININIELSDQTGTLIESRLSGHVAERVMGIKTDDFQRLSERERTGLKWRFLLKYFEVKLLIRKPAGMRKNLSAIVVDMQEIALNKLVEKIAVF
ncbi:protein hold'em [Drosophila pseudoobscura]|uniref:Protein hold'em n=1 Tax=Drosophila pseudoobscura pseudoobscura TaxID=46245 RepID=A0A6I8V568_DROPS|nr:protein hold'em [Drosophila pseudoobscura]